MIRSSMATYAAVRKGAVSTLASTEPVSPLPPDA
jgi:hypothetical protein